MRVFSHTVTPRTAITDYRIYTPLEGLEAYARLNNLPFDLSIDEFHPSTTPDTRLMNFHKADILYTHVAVAVQVYETFAALKAAMPMWHRATGEIKPPPAIVLDMDDLYTDIAYTNPSFGFWGVHREDGTMLEPGDKIVVNTVDKGDIVLWEDGMVMGEAREGRHAVFDIEANHKRVATLMRLMSEADLLVTTNSRLADVYAERFNIPREKFFVFPNSIIPKQWDEVQVLVQKDPEEVRILWQGGWSHAEDIFEVRDAMARVAHKYPNTKWCIYGHRFSWWENMIPENQRMLVTWTPYEQYKLKLGTLNPDINLCPLRDTLFNSCKSPIKWYEATLTATRPATLAARVGPFMDEMVDGETGFLYSSPEEFETKLCQLIEDEQLRKRLGQAAHKWITENRALQTTVPSLYARLTALVEEKRETSRIKLPRNKVNTYGILRGDNSYVGAGQSSGS